MDENHRTFISGKGIKTEWRLLNTYYPQRKVLNQNQVERNQLGKYPLRRIVFQ